MDTFTKKAAYAGSPVLLACLAIVLIIGAAALAYHAEQGGSSVSVTTASPTATPSTSPVSTANAIPKSIYANTKLGYSFTYPINSVQLTASIGDNYDLAITPTADSVNAFLKGGSVRGNIFSVDIPGIELTPGAIQKQFGGSIAAQNLSVTSATIGEGSGYKLTELNDSSVISNFYFVKTANATVLELTVVNASKDAQDILNSFKISK